MDGGFPACDAREVAVLAGVSTDYYARLEQGRTRQVGRPVLEAVAAALRLGEVEREYLLALVEAQNGPRQRTRGPRPVVHPGALRLLDSFDHAAALVLGRGTSLLAMNATARALLFDPDEHPAVRHNLALWRFLDPEARQRYASWEAVAYDTAATLRRDAVEDPDDPELRAVLSELGAKSEDFARMWREHRVYDCAYGTKDLVHPLVGELYLDYIALGVPRAPGQRLHVYTAAPGSPSEDRLRRLAAWARPDATVDHFTSDRHHHPT